MQPFADFSSQSDSMAFDFSNYSTHRREPRAYPVFSSLVTVVFFMDPSWRFPSHQGKSCACIGVEKTTSRRRYSCYRRNNKLHGSRHLISRLVEGDLFSSISLPLELTAPRKISMLIGHSGKSGSPASLVTDLSRFSSATALANTSRIQTTFPSQHPRTMTSI